MQDISRVSFYVEPVVFRQDPLFLRPWLEWLSSIINSNNCNDKNSFSIISSPWICDYLKKINNNIEAFHLSPNHILRSFDMNRALYGLDLFRDSSDPIVNRPLFDMISSAVSEFKPEAIFSFSQNRYLPRVEPAITTVFSELQPLPRALSSGFFVDPHGHQTESILVRQWPLIKTSPPPTSTEEADYRDWIKVFKQRISDETAVSEVATWLKASANRAPIAMFALQPPDWLTWEGAGISLAPEDFLLRGLDALPTGWVAIATYHPGHRLPRDIEECIARQMPNLLLLPEHWKVGRSEYLLPYVDAVITTSSTVGWSALLLQKRVVALGNSNMRAIAENKIENLNSINPLNRKNAARLLHYLTNKYCIPKEKMLHEEGFFINLISNIRENAESYFSTIE